MHEPVLLSEAMESLPIRGDGVYLDGTFGRGGHSRAILERLGPAGRLIALDREPAAAWLARAEEQQIREVIRNYGEERFAKQIAAAIVAARRREPLLRTRQLADLVAKAVRTREPGQDPATRTFQALRIHVNRELEEVSLMLPQAARHLEQGGRLAVISFHS